MGKRDSSVEVGRVVVVNFGPDAGKICVVVDVIDASRLLVDGPKSQTGVSRGSLNIRHASVTNIKVDIARGIKTAAIEKIFSEADIMGQWNKTSWAKKADKSAKRSNMSDFDRFKCMLLRKQRSKIIKKQLDKLKA
jgi:large subunit ribosomal protein L14e